MADIGQTHTHPSGYWLAGNNEEDKKQKNRLRILIAGIVIALILLIICIILAIGRAQLTGYVPTLIMELDLSPIGKPPLVLATVQLPKIFPPFPVKLEFPDPKIQQELKFDQSFTPVINRRVEYVPIYKLQ